MKFVIFFNIIFIVLNISQPVFSQFVLSGDDLGGYVSVGVACGDFDNDGDDDIYFSNGDSQGNAWEGLLYENDGIGCFTCIMDAGPIVTDIYTSGGCCWGDYNNDGYLDLIVANPRTTSDNSKISLYSNNGDGTFSDLPSCPLLTENTISKIDPAWADFNNDGWLDVLVSNATVDGMASNHTLYVNGQNGMFTPVDNTLTSGMTARGTMSWIDVDNDGDADALTIAGSISQNTTLWINTGSDFTEHVLITGGDSTGMNSHGASWGDYDNDGDMDLYVSNYGISAEVNLLFRNDSLDGSANPIMTRLDSTSGVGDLISDMDYSVVSAWGDVDNDGDLDLFVGNDGGTISGYHSRLYINTDGFFAKDETDDIHAKADSIRSAAFSDVDNDGDLDLIVGRDGFNYLFTNTQITGNNWAKFKLEGIDANKAAIGAVVKIRATIGGKEIWQMRTVSSHTGYASQSSLIVHFGLGDATIIDELIIKWPGSGTLETATNLPVNQLIECTEHFASSIRALDIMAPGEFSLFQNYPNPFNPKTTIRFSIPKAGHVSLDVYNIIGQKVMILIDGQKSAGAYEVDVDASRLSSGIFFYTLQCGDFKSMKKMIVVR